MGERGYSLAHEHKLRTQRGRDRLLPRLKDNSTTIADTCVRLTSMAKSSLRITPAGEWLLDNRHLIETQISDVRRFLPEGYSHELPLLDAGESSGLPRVYDLATKAVAHSDGRIDAETISRLFAAYQAVAPLKLGELWAIPIMLRLALIENLRRMCVQIKRDADDQQIAAEWAASMNTTAEHEARQLVLVVADLARSNPPLSGAFVAELIRGLSGRNAVLAMPMAWIEQWLADEGYRIEALIQDEGRQQAHDQVSISNSIGSLRFLDTMDWREFVETMSVVEHTLRQDPAGTYGLMDFATRNAYRHVVESLARRSGANEIDVAQAILELAQAGPATDLITSHVGYYLVDDGAEQVPDALAICGSARRRLRPQKRRPTLAIYLLAIIGISATLAAALLSELRPIPLSMLTLGGILGLALLAYSELGIALVNWMATVLVPPRSLPRMDFSSGIPSTSRTLVVIPSMIGSQSAVDELVEGLEVRFLANRDGHLHFALLTDFPDADRAVLADDDAIVGYASMRIAQLNTRYAPERNDLFFLFHRPRLWNPNEGVWMGHERKRGKLIALNRLLRGGSDEAFVRIVGDRRVLDNVRYVITLDADTQLPRDAAREFVAILAHPLNAARVDERRGVVLRGYGILQPGVGSSIGRVRRTRYAHMYGSEPGIDPYTRTVSDVYQDLFAEGSFVGKGIYDVDAFEKALDGRCPDNRILSHDLLEGCYARAGFVSDVRLYEDYPSRYVADVKRRSRWIRGDWQLLPWLLPHVPLAEGGHERNPLSWLSRGKLLDNLRRSLVAPATLILFVTGWILLPQPLGWTAWLLGVWLMPVLFQAIRDTLAKPLDMSWMPHLKRAVNSAGRQLHRVLVDFACLPHQAWYSLRAIIRTLWRMMVSGRHLLQWAPSSDVERALDRDAFAELREMWFAPVLALACTAAVWRLNPTALWLVAPILGLWLASPALMSWLSRASRPSHVRLSHAERAFLGRLARRTWAYFETLLDDEGHWLPPDNIQVHPTAAVAQRTSPTNIGLSLLANLAAHDFGYLQAGALAERTQRTLTTLASLTRHRGHFYNWYDTRTLQPLPPAYVSTVDSGNLAGHLLTLRQGLLALPDAGIPAPNTFAGLADTLDVLREQVDEQASHPEGLRPALAAFVERLAAAGAEGIPSPHKMESTLTALLEQARTIAAVWTSSIPADTSEALAFDASALADACQAALDELRHFGPWPTGLGPDGTGSDPPIATLRTLAAGVNGSQARERARERIGELERLADIAMQCSVMDYAFLYDPARHLLAIGYNIDERRLDTGHYDLLASEARLCSFVAIAQGQLPQDTWFALGRLLTDVDGDATLLSWSGSMFEYLMPQLVMPSYPDTLLDQTSRHAVEAQIRYGRHHNVPWGISESGYNAFDARLNYQYRAFGVPGLGLKRGLGQDLVIAPYASMMALMVAPEAACQNLQRLESLGARGRFGLFEAIDYTPVRLPPGQTCTIVRSFMAHHQGMGLLSLAYLLHDQPMQRRFVADPQFQATLLLLQERLPNTGTFHPHNTEIVAARSEHSDGETRLRIFTDPYTDWPAIQLLSNGNYHCLLSHAGGGYSRLGNVAVTRWREDATRDHWGSFCYLRDAASGEFWSASHQPTCAPVEGYEAIFSDAKVEYRGHRRGFDSHLEIAVSSEDNIELRRLHLCNRTRQPRTVEITTYAEVVLATGRSDELHPAFSNLFVQTKIVPDKQALVCTRRPRSSDEVPPWMIHLVAVHGADLDAISYETDRARFLGRGRTPRAPQALDGDDPLSNTDGPVLDPIVAIRCRMTLAPEQTAVIDMVTGIGANRAACDALIDKYRDRRLADRVFDLAWTHSQVVQRQINASQADAQLYERMAGLMVYADPLLRADADVLRQNRRGQSALWGHAISGDLPIALLRISSTDGIELVRQMVQAHAYWRLKGLEADLVIWNEDQAGYRNQLQEQIVSLVCASPETNLLDRPGGIFVRQAQQIPHEDKILLQSVARIVVSDSAGTLAAQAGRRHSPKRTPESLLSGSQTPTALLPSNPPPPIMMEEQAGDAVAGRMLFDNGIGAFSADSREYVITLDEGVTTPAPWVNVIANPNLGTVVSESTAGYTWFENAHEFRLTPWHNDPVADPSGEAFYLRDEDTGQVWSPMPFPCRGRGSYRVRHGFGYSVYEHVEDGIASELWIYVAPEDPVKFMVLKLHNRSERTRRLSVTAYVEWVLGSVRSASLPHVVSEVDHTSGMLTARNPFNMEFGGHVAFFDCDAVLSSFTTDRIEFIGRNGSLGEPAALARERLSGSLGAGLDPCAAIQAPITLSPGRSEETVFRLGAGRRLDDAIGLAARHRGVDAAHDALKQVREHWCQVHEALHVETPEPSLDLMVNDWLPYQILSCRYHGRSGFYQSGGAIGFRDQLQDTMATVHADPGLTRAHLLLSASHQFPQGDVLHWWHPPAGRGVRTRCSDDYLWLPAAVCRYLEVTGDTAVLDEPVPFIDGRALDGSEESHYDLPADSGQVRSLYAHCMLALERGCALTGARGLPLIGSGDWNDGMNRVGIDGVGESVWLGFFLFDVLTRFADVAHAHDDGAFASRCLDHARQLRERLDVHAWDGEWYRRAWFDDDSPLGSTQSAECRIDSIAQSWAVLSGAADPERARQAMASLDRHLVHREADLVQLLHPPFDGAGADPGYIRGYLPGVRENGGQYTHAAIWAAMAFARLGDQERAWELTRLIDPIRHALDPDAVARYKVEPYVLAADVYAVAPHTGRGGWTWYTGSAGWMYRLITESLLGLRRTGAILELNPCIPAEWPGYRLRYRYGKTLYQFDVSQVDEGPSRVWLDGIEQAGVSLYLVDDQRVHMVRVSWPRSGGPAGT